MLGNLKSEETKIRFLSKVDQPTDHRLCWPWLGGTRRNRGGNLYGRFWLDGKDQLAHRVSFRIFIGDLKEEHTIDHLCKITLCVNPHHLEPVTGKVNILRGVGVGAVNARKTNCPSGHEFKPRDGGKRRWCPVCQNQRRKERNLGNVS